MISNEVPELSYLNLCIIQYPYNISIYHTSHIQYTILVQWFPYAFEKVIYDTTPFKSDITFEISLSETLTATPDELHILEDHHLVKFSAHIRKNIHIMKYTRPDIIYFVNRISIHASAPSEPDFQRIKHLICYLDGCPHRPIMYPSGLYETTTHDLHQ